MYSGVCRAPLCETTKAVNRALNRENDGARSTSQHDRILTGRNVNVLEALRFKIHLILAKNFTWDGQDIWNSPKCSPQFIHFKCWRICIPAHNCSAHSVFMFFHKANPKSLCSRARFEARWRNHWTRCHSFLNSVSGCLNWLALCQLRTEVGRFFFLGTSLSVPCPGMRQDWGGHREETWTAPISVFLGSPFGGFYFKQ